MDLHSTRTQVELDRAFAKYTLESAARIEHLGDTNQGSGRITGNPSLTLFFGSPRSLDGLQPGFCTDWRQYNQNSEVPDKMVGHGRSAPVMREWRMMRFSNGPRAALVLLLTAVVFLSGNALASQTLADPVYVAISDGWMGLYGHGDEYARFSIRGKQVVLQDAYHILLKPGLGMNVNFA